MDMIPSSLSEINCQISPSKTLVLRELGAVRLRMVVADQTDCFCVDPYNLGGEVQDSGIAAAVALGSPQHMPGRHRAACFADVVVVVDNSALAVAGCFGMDVVAQLMAAGDTEVDHMLAVAEVPGNSTLVAVYGIAVVAEAVHFDGDFGVAYCTAAD